MKFKLWLEEIEKDRHYWEEFFLAVFHLNRAGGGLGKNLAGFNAKDLIANSEFTQMDQQRQEAIINKVQTGEGTVDDLAAIASGEQSPTDPPAPKFSVPVQQNNLAT